MILKKISVLVCMFLVLTSCQFTETLVLNEDGSGRMNIEMNMNELMAFGGDEVDSVVTKMDTIISMKQFLLEKKDSISQLPKKEQESLQKMENYNIRMIMDSEKKEMLFSIYTDFTNIEEANNLMTGLDKTSSLMPGVNSTPADSEENTDNVMGVAYSYKKGKFSRDAFIIDKARHQQQVDSMKNTESFMSSMVYKLKYTFPKKIKKSSIKDATFSLDGKTIEVERSFIDYFKNPDVLDLEVEFEN
jgi:hypothetical protein